MSRMLFIYEQVDPKPAKGNRYRLIEHYLSVDGWRSRVTEHCCDSLEQAQAVVRNIKEEDQA